MGVCGERVDSGFRQLALVRKSFKVRRDGICFEFCDPCGPLNLRSVVYRPKGVKRFRHLCVDFGIGFYRSGRNIFSADRVVPLTGIYDEVYASTDRFCVGLVNVTMQPEYGKERLERRIAGGNQDVGVLPGGHSASIVCEQIEADGVDPGIMGGAHLGS